MDTDSVPLLNQLGWDHFQQMLLAAEELRIEPVETDTDALILDCGIETPGSLGAGIALAEVCLASLAELSIQAGELAGVGWPNLFISTDSPVEACLLSQYAGWQISVGKYFAMGSGPMRAAAALEEIFTEFEYKEEAPEVIGVLESGKIPTREVIEYIAEKCGVATERVALLVAPTSSIAGNIQVVSRSIETALHKLHALGFDVNAIESACGWAPIPPVAADDLTGIGRTNDAILYGGRVTLWVTGHDDDIAAVAPQVPSVGSNMYGRPFLEIFEAAGRDFYKIDPMLFSPAEVVFHNLDTGKVHVTGRTNPEILKRSFGF